MPLLCACGNVHLCVSHCCVGLAARKHVLGVGFSKLSDRPRTSKEREVQEELLGNRTNLQLTSAIQQNPRTKYV